MSLFSRVKEKRIKIKKMKQYLNLNRISNYDTQIGPIIIFFAISHPFCQTKDLWRWGAEMAIYPANEDPAKSAPYEA